MSLTREQIKVRKQWVDALRSGEYKQVRGSLWGDAPNEFCAVGLVCCGPLKDDYKRFRLMHPEATGNEAFYGITGFDREAHHTVVKMNNGWGSYAPHTFEEIADTIELLTLAGE